MNTKVNVVECGYSGLLIEMPFSDKQSFEEGDEVIFKDTEGKEEYGLLKYWERESVDPDKIQFTAKILRKASANDIQKVESHIEQAQAAAEKCKDLIESLDLDMSLFRTGLSLDGEKLHFMFTSDDRVDFRDLVKELARIFKKQISLRQIGPRDKAKMVGGYGKCGRTLCCNTWLGKFTSINMEMVRSQALESKGSSKLSGVCGKLLCCLKYEVEAYRELKKSLPPYGSILKLAKVDGGYKVIGLDILNQKMKVVSDQGEFKVVSVTEVEKVSRPSVERSKFKNK